MPVNSSPDWRLPRRAVGLPRLFALRRAPTLMVESRYGQRVEYRPRHS